MKLHNKLWILLGAVGLFTVSCDPVIDDLDPDIIAPNLVISSPAIGDTFAPGSEITITGNVTDDIGLGSIRILKEDWGIDTTWTDSSTNFSIDYTFTLPEEINLDERQVVKVMVTDGATNEVNGNVIINFGGDTVDPTITVTSPTAGAEVFQGDPLDIKVAVADNFALAKLRVAIADLGYDQTVSMNGLMAYTFNATGDKAFSVPLDADTGTTTLAITVTDINGNEATTSTDIRVVPLPEFDAMYMVGAFNGWDIAAAPKMTKDANDGFIFRGRVEFTEPNQEFKFVSTQDWGTATAFGQDANGNPTTADGAPNLVGPATAGLVQVTFNVKSLTFTTEEVAAFENLYMVGSFQGWDINAAPAMTKVTDDIFALRVTLDAGGVFKIVNTQDWDTNDEFGTDDDGNLELGGPNNISGPASAGEYLVIINTAANTLDIRATTNSLYMVGDATQGGWDNTTATRIFRNDDFEYTYTGKFNAGSFKFLTTLGQWAPQYGVNDGTTLFFRATESDPDPGNFAIATEGYYTVSVNVATGVWSLKSFDEGSAMDYTSMGLIGAGIGGWDDADEITLTQSSFDSHIWTLTGQAANGDVKFRGNASWDFAWGPSTPATYPYGVSIDTPGSPNFSLADGTYTFIFNDLTGHYIIQQ